MSEVPTPLPVDTWERWVLDLPADESGDAAFLHKVLTDWCSAVGAAGAALYGLGERGFERHASVGKGPFPAQLGGRPVPGAEQLVLPGGLLLWRPEREGETVPRPTHHLGMVAVAVRLCRMRDRLKREQFQASLRGVELEALYEVGLAIASTLDFERLTDVILLHAVSLLDARRGALYLLDEAGDLQLKAAIGGEARDSTLPEVPANPGELLPGAQFLLNVPIAADGTVRGLLVVADRESRQGVGPFAPDSERRLGLLANQAAIALENARLHREALEKERLERDMQLAADIQRQILPKGVPQVPGFEVVGWNHPARQVGGDYYDFIPLPGGQLGVVVGDVSGKGMPAALMMSMLHSAIHLLLSQVTFGPELFDRINRHIVASSAANKFITLLVGCLDPATGELDYVNAGHNPGLVLRATNGEVEELPPGGVPIGLLADVRFRAARLRLEPSDLLCLYSDGITEAASLEDVELGEAGLIELLRTARADEPLSVLLERIQHAVAEVAEGGPQGDDQTVVLLRRTSLPPA